MSATYRNGTSLCIKCGRLYHRENRYVGNYCPECRE